MSVLNAQQAYISTFSGTGANGQSAFVTFSIANTAGFDLEVPVEIRTPASVSAGAEVWVYRSQDGGANYSTERTRLGLAFQRAASSTQIDTLRLDNGQFLVSVLVGGGSSATWSVRFAVTARLVSAYVAV